MWTLLIRIVASYKLDLSSITVFYSDQTPTELLSEFSQFNHRIRLSVQTSFNELVIPEGSLFVDLTLSTGLLPLLDVIALSCEGIYLTLSTQEPGFYSKRRIHAVNNEILELEVLKKMLKFLSFNEFILLTSSNFNSLKLSQLLYEEHKGKIFQFIKYGEDITLNIGLSLVLRMIKSTGINKILIVGEAKNLKVIQTSIIQKRINEAGAVFLFTSSANGSVFLEGSLTLCEQGAENSTSYSNYLYNLIISKLEKLQSIESQKSGFQLSYSILNTQESIQKTVGIISEYISITSPILYPGNISSPSELKNKYVTFLIANGTYEIYNYYHTDEFSIYYNGALYAANQANRLNEIPHFQFNLRQADTGLYLYEENWYKQKLSEVLIDPYPIAMLTNIWSISATGTSKALSNMNVSIPQISPFAAQKEAESRENFPQLLKLTVSFTESLLNILDFILSFGWTSISIICTKDNVYFPYYIPILNIVKARGFKIVNPEDKRILPNNYTRDDFEQFKSYFQEIKKSKCRVILILSFEMGYLFEGLYDVGLRKGDLISFTGSVSSNHLIDVEKKFLLKRKEFFSEFFIFSVKEWNGDLGESLKKVFTEIYTNPVFMCLCYDTFLVVKEAVKYMLTIGEDYQDPEKLLHQMRENKFIGCTGQIYFSKDSTSVSNNKFAIIQILFHSNGTMYISEVAHLDKLSSQFIQYVIEPKWGTDSIPKNFIENIDCPFELRDIKKTNKGHWVLVSLCAIIFILACIFSFLSHLKYKLAFKELTEKQIMSFSDRAFYLYFLFQFMQILAMGPDQEAIKNISNQVGLLLSFDFDQFYNLTVNEFWILFYIILGFTIFWVIICLIFVFGLDIKYQDLWVCGQLSTFGNLIFPLIGSNAFLPIFSILMNLYLCSESIGDSLTDSFMDHDCYTFCYKGKHKILVAVTAIMIIFHVSLTVYCKPLWETTQDSLAIRTKSSYLSVLSLFQVSLVILNKTLKLKSQFIHGCLCTSLVFLVVIFTIIVKPYNHQPAFVIQISSLSMSFWGLLVSTIFLKFDNFIALSITEFAGFITIITITSIALSKTPSFLYTTKGIDVSALFIFQFCKNYGKYSIDIESLDISIKTKYRSESGQNNLDKVE